MVSKKSRAFILSCPGHLARLGGTFFLVQDFCPGFLVSKKMLHLHFFLLRDFLVTSWYINQKYAPPSFFCPKFLVRKNASHSFFSCPGFLVSTKMPRLHVFLYRIFGKQKKCPSGFASIAPSGIVGAIAPSGIVGAIAPSGIVGAAAIAATTSTFVGAFAATASTFWIPRPTPPHCCESTNLALQPSHLTCNG